MKHIQKHLALILEQIGNKIQPLLKANQREVSYNTDVMRTVYEDDGYKLTITRPHTAIYDKKKTLASFITITIRDTS